MEKTLVLIKPSGVHRNLVGEIIRRFEQKGLQLCGLKMMQLDATILESHYAHLLEKPYFKSIKDSMMISPIVACCWGGLDVVEVAHRMAGATNGREAAFGTIRGDYCVSIQENIIHTSDSVQNARIEINRFFNSDEIFDYQPFNLTALYAANEL